MFYKGDKILNYSVTKHSIPFYLFEIRGKIGSVCSPCERLPVIKLLNKEFYVDAFYIVKIDYEKIIDALTI